jgi:hypothetical protein
MVLSGDSVNLSVHVDAGASRRWMEQPYRADIDRWIMQLRPLGGRLVIYEGKRATVFEAGQRIEMIEQLGGDYGVVP